MLVEVEPTGVSAGILPASAKAGMVNAATLALECYMSARVSGDVWIAVFSQPSAGRVPMHAPDLPFPLCLALLPDTECVCVAFRCSATTAAFCHWPPGIVIEWLHLGLKQWHAAASLMQRTAQSQSLDVWLAATFDSQWTLPTEHLRRDVAIAAERDIPQCRDAPALSTGAANQSMHDAQMAESDPCIGVYDILASASVRTDVTGGSGNGSNTNGGTGRKATSARAAAAQSRRLLVAAAIHAAAAAAAPAEDMDILMSDDDSELDEDEGLEDEDAEEEDEEEDAEDELDDESDIGEDLVLPDVIVGEDKDDDEEDEDASSFDEDASSDADISE